MTEYIIILSLVAVAAITVFSAFGGANRAQVAAVANEIAGNHEAAKRSTQLAQNYAKYASDTASYSRNMGNYNSSPDWGNYSGGYGAGSGGSGTGGSGSGGSGIGSSGSGDPVISSCGVDKGGYAVAAKGAKPVKIDGTSGEICSETKKIKTFSKKLSDALELIKNTSEGARIISELENNPEIIKVFIKEGGTGLGLTKVVDLTPDRSILNQ